MNQNSKPFYGLIQQALVCIEDILGPELKSIYLFGSLARGQAKISSDIDLLLDMKHDYPSRVIRSEVYEALDSLAVRDKMFSVVFSKGGKVESFSTVFNKAVETDKILLKEYK